MKKYFETKVGAENFAKEFGGKVVMKNVPDYMGVITVIYVEWEEKKSEKNHYCYNCRFLYDDASVGISECNSDYMSEDDYDKYHIENGGSNCPYFCACMTDEEIEEQVRYYEGLMKEVRL